MKVTAIFIAVLFTQSYATDVVTDLAGKLLSSPLTFSGPPKACRLMPFVELSPLLAIKRRTDLNDTTKAAAINVYYEAGLSAMLYAGCMLTRRIGSTKAKAVLDQWISGYDNDARKLIVESDFDKAKTDGTSATTDRACREKQIIRLRASTVTKNPGTWIQDEIINMTSRLAGKISPAQLKVATEQIAMRCLGDTPDLNGADKVKMGEALAKAAKFFHHIEGGLLQSTLGEEKQDSVLATLLREILGSNHLTSKEKVDRLVTTLKGKQIRQKMTCDKDHVEDCIDGIANNLDDTDII
eukprot:Seg2147.7 transcript_id=Seg2147.7/GoldUCD/mRNA.D3Y31 product="hypothetical protein" protein_id=Seg2147.7/GoldUCD/D3Y31